MHDDRIAGVTFEENTSRNALIVNEEYAWVGNPFSAQKGRSKRAEESMKPCISMICKAFLPPSTTSVEAKGSSHFIHGSYLSSAGLSPDPYAAPDRTERRNRFFGYRLYKAEAGQLINHIAAGCPASILTAGCITWHNIPYRSGMLPY